MLNQVHKFGKCNMERKRSVIRFISRRNDNDLYILTEFCGHYMRKNMISEDVVSGIEYLASPVDTALLNTLSASYSIKSEAGLERGPHSV
jgi:hypothetical protein